MIQKFGLGLLIGLILSTSCKEQEKVIEYIPQETKTNISYGSDPKQNFNIFLPENRSSSTPVLFLIHGGGWSAGDKSDFDASLPSFKNLFPTYSLVVLNYRLYASGMYKFPAQELDVKSCIEYVMIHSTEYRLSQNFAVLGISAGAHLATLYAYKYGSTSYLPKAVIDVSGPIELKLAYNQVASTIVKGWISDVAGNPGTSDSLLYKSSSPYYYVKSTSAPTLILHGDADTIVPPQQAVLLNNALQSYNVPHVYKVYPGEGHGFSSSAVADIQLQIKNFLKTHLN